MGGKSSKPLRDAGRAVLARRQVPVEPPVHVPPQATPSVQHVDMPHAHHEPAPAREEPAHLPHVPSEDKRIPLQMEPPAPSSSQQSSTVEPPVFPEQRPPSSDDFSNPSGAPLPPDLLAAISKWQVRKNVAPQAPKSIEKARFRSAAEIRHQKDLEISQREQQGLPLVGRLTEMQLHNFYKRVRDQPNIAAAEIAAEFHLTENMAQLLLDVARLPVILRSPDEDQSEAL
eukprot:gene3286-2422_t